MDLNILQDILSKLQPRTPSRNIQSMPHPKNKKKATKPNRNLKTNLK